MTQLLPFEFGTVACPVRLDDHGEPWWVLQDICRAISLENTSKVAARLRPHEITTITFSESGIPHNLLLVNESGLYRVIMRSNKPEAERFQDWVCQEVLPQIRKTGSYSLPQAPALPDPASQLALCQATYAFLEELGCATDRDRLAIADYARNGLRSAQGLLTAPASSPTAYGFSVSERVAQLGYRLTRSQQSALYGPLGKRLAAEYRSRTGEDPRKEPRYVDGATRPVSWYAAEDAAWVDPLVQAFLASMAIRAEAS